MGLVHTEPSLRDAKALMASTSIAGIEDDSDSGFGEFADEDSSSEDEGGVSTKILLVDKMH